MHISLPQHTRFLSFIISFPFSTTYFKEIDTYGYLINYNGKTENFIWCLLLIWWLRAGNSNEQNNVPFLREFTFYWCSRLVTLELKLLKLILPYVT